MKVRRRFPFTLIGKPKARLTLIEARELRKTVPNILSFKYKSHISGKHSYCVFFKEDFVEAWNRIHRDTKESSFLKSKLFWEFLRITGFRKYISSYGLAKTSKYKGTVLKKLKDKLEILEITTCSHNIFEKDCWLCFRKEVLNKRRKK